MITLSPANATPATAVWIDLFNPDEADKTLAEQGFGLDLPSRGDLEEIESSSRHYTEDGRIYLSTPFMTRDADGEETVITPIGFILERHRLVTQRFGHANLFWRLAEGLDKRTGVDGVEAFCYLTEAIVDHQADQLESIANALETISRNIFRVKAKKKIPGDADAADDLKNTLAEVGRLGARIGQIRSSLLGMGRILPYVSETARDWLSADQLGRISVARQDLVSLADYESHLANKVQFLLDAVLGFISIEQNEVVKVLTIVSVIGVPPVLIAGIYGMNFKVMPELEWAYGYPMAIFLMVVTTLAPLIWFRLRRWF